MKLNKLSLRDRGIFEKYLRAASRELSVYAFENIFIWKGLFDISWGIVENNLCVFFKDRLGCFLYLPPLGKKVNARNVKAAFEVMDKFNRANYEISRIENVEEKKIGQFRRLGYEISAKPPEYICVGDELSRLKGDKFRHKRASCNYFVKHYAFEYRLFSLRKHKEECLKLYRRWAKERRLHSNDSLYQGMLKDSSACLKKLLDNYQKLKIIGRVVAVNKKLKGFTFGFRLNKDIFCILYEITDLRFKGLAQFIFREFCCELKGYKYINIMDDSGLENLRKVKLSYRPVRLAPAYIVKRKNEYR